jgi:hypothetical protein
MRRAATSGAPRPELHPPQAACSAGAPAAFRFSFHRWGSRPAYCTGRVVATRGSTSVSQATGSTPCCRQIFTKEKKRPDLSAPASEPANRKLCLPIAIPPPFCPCRDDRSPVPVARAVRPAAPGRLPRGPRRLGGAGLRGSLGTAARHPRVDGRRNELRGPDRGLAGRRRPWAARAALAPRRGSGRCSRLLAPRGASRCPSPHRHPRARTRRLFLRTCARRRTCPRQRERISSVSGRAAPVGSGACSKSVASTRAAMTASAGSTAEAASGARGREVRLVRLRSGGDTARSGVVAAAHSHRSGRKGGGTRGSNCGCQSAPSGVLPMTTEYARSWRYSTPPTPQKRVCVGHEAPLRAAKPRRPDCVLTTWLRGSWPSCSSVLSASSSSSSIETRYPPRSGPSPIWPRGPDCADVCARTLSTSCAGGASVCRGPASGECRTALDGRASVEAALGGPA